MEKFIDIFIFFSSMFYIKFIYILFIFLLGLVILYFNKAQISTTTSIIRIVGIISVTLASLYFLFIFGISLYTYIYG